jgi:uncharacterized protein (DUF1778 family)
VAVHRQRQDETVAGATRTRDKRLEVRTSAEERALIDRAAEVAGTDLTTFVVTHVTEAAQRVLADRDQFALSAEAAAEWDKINRRGARDLPGLRRLFDRPSPFDS